MVFSEATGKAAITASDDQVGFVVFGVCAPVSYPTGREASGMLDE